MTPMTATLEQACRSRMAWLNDEHTRRGAQFVRGLGSATWWGLPALAGVFVGLGELGTGSYGWGAMSISLGAVLLLVARARYRSDGHL